jgi:putative transcriptional regulator
MAGKTSKHEADAAAEPDADEGARHRVRVRLDTLLIERGMTLAELSRQVGISQVNLSTLKNGRARAIRFSTLTAMCDVLDCTPGDLLELDRC